MRVSDVRAGLAAGRLVQPIAVFARDRGGVLDRVFGRGQVAALAEFLVAVEFDQKDRLATGIAAFAEHRDARDEPQLGRALCDAVVRVAGRPLAGSATPSPGCADML